MVRALHGSVGGHGVAEGAPPLPCVSGTLGAPGRPPSAAASLLHQRENTLQKMAQVTLAEEGLDTLFGTNDENLRRVERTFDGTVAARDNKLNIQGDPERVLAV